MPSIQVPDKKEEGIIRGNGADPKRYGVRSGVQSESVIRLLCYKTRDDVEIQPDYGCPTLKEARILMENGFDSDVCKIVDRTDCSIVFTVDGTMDVVRIRKGDRPW